MLVSVPRWICSTNKVVIVAETILLSPNHYPSPATISLGHFNVHASHNTQPSQEKEPRHGQDSFTASFLYMTLR